MLSFVELMLSFFDMILSFDDDDHTDEEEYHIEEGEHQFDEGEHQFDEDGQGEYQFEKDERRRRRGRGHRQKNAHWVHCSKLVARFVFKLNESTQPSQTHARTSDDIVHGCGESFVVNRQCHETVSGVAIRYIYIYIYVQI